VTLDAAAKPAETRRHMAWVYLFLAGITEVAWAVGLKQTDGWTRLWPSVITAILMVVSFVLLSLALRALPIGTAYAVWTGIGAVGTAIIGIIFFGEPRTAVRLGCIALILIGIVGLKVSSPQ
jgi:quaternary ammonium compound-resistance protein SugE